MRVMLPQDAACALPSRRWHGPGAVVALSASAAGATRQLPNGTSAISTADSQTARLAQAARAWSMGNCGSGGAAGSVAHAQNGHTLESGHTEHAGGKTVPASCPAASEPLLQQPASSLRDVLAPGSRVPTSPAAVQAALLSLRPLAHPAQLRTAGPDEQAGPAAGGQVVHGALAETALQLPRDDQAPLAIWPGSFLQNSSSSSRQQQQQQQWPPLPHHAQHNVAAPEQPTCDAPAPTAATVHAPLDSFNWHENLPEEVSAPVVNFWLPAEDTWTLSCATTRKVVCDLQSRLKLASVYHPGHSPVSGAGVRGPQLPVDARRQSGGGGRLGPRRLPPVSLLCSLLRPAGCSACNLLAVVQPQLLQLADHRCTSLCSMHDV